MNRLSRESPTIGPAILLTVTLAFFAGCRGASDLPGPTGTVSGKATYRDKPIPEGSAIVFFHTESGITGTALTDAEGNFTASMRDGPDLLVGDYSVNVRPPGEPDENVMVYTLNNVPPAWKEIPQRYWTLTTSPEKFSVREGANSYELVLTDP